MSASTGAEGSRALGSRAARLAWPLVAGAVVIAAGTALGWNGGLLERLASPPAIVRAALVAVSVVLALALLREALLRLEGSGRPGAQAQDVPALVRGIRFVFLAVAAASAAAGWLIAHPLPLVVALIVAGVDVLETSFLLIVVAVRGRDG
ncbi:MAG TPA: hypothetical protein VFS32_07520 [Candidatus Limnocylindrales bacterium]|nr:hypothetical protein [Candidatus Limnocylindrales bacterium]